MVALEENFIENIFSDEWQKASENSAAFLLLPPLVEEELLKSVHQKGLKRINKN